MPDQSRVAVQAGRLGGRPQPTLSVRELVLRPWRAEDAAAVVQAYRDPAIQHWHVRSMTEPEALAWIESWAAQWTGETAVSWAVVEGEAVLGRMGFNGVDLMAGRAEAAYWLLPEARGRGVAARALRAATAWMFAEVGMHRIELLHACRNEPSCRVAIAARYSLEGTKREHWLLDDGWHDVHLHARLRDDPT
jgi:ribosomal-protein-alanine N-acetyltransferase